MNAIQHLREKLNLTQTEFGKKIGVSRPMIFRYENGWNNPSISVANRIIKLADKYGLKLTLSMIILE